MQKGIAMKWIDLPPVWLAGFIGLTVLVKRYDTWGLTLDHPITQLLSAFFIGGGIILMLLAVSEMRRQRTTFIPHRDADRLVQSGIFKRSRNPIYLGDVMVATGVILWVDIPQMLLLVPVFLWILERRFVIPEEDRLRAKFRAEFARYCEKTRRWL